MKHVAHKFSLTFAASSIEIMPVAPDEETVILAIKMLVCMFKRSALVEAMLWTVFAAHVIWLKVLSVELPEGCWG